MGGFWWILVGEWDELEADVDTTIDVSSSETLLVQRNITRKREHPVPSLILGDENEVRVGMAVGAYSYKIKENERTDR